MRIAFIISLLANFSFAQPNFQTPLPDSMGYWMQFMYVSGGVNDPDPFWSYSFQFYTGNDTIIDSLTYKKLHVDYNYTDIIHYYIDWEDGPLVGYYRNDGDKVYYLHEYNSAAPYSLNDYSVQHFQTLDEILLYDFGLQVGDTFELIKDNYIEVSYIDTIYQDNHPYKRIHFFDTNWPNEIYLPYNDYYWVEGVGAITGFFPYFDNFERWLYFECFHEYEYVYNFNNVDNQEYSCYYFSGIEEPAFKLNVFPNPVSGKLTISDVDFSKVSSIRIIDLMGNVIRNGIFPKNNTIDLSPLSTGVYLLELITEEGRFTTRIIKE